jgi:hypothetical protein
VKTGNATAHHHSAVDQAIKDAKIIVVDTSQFSLNKNNKLLLNIYIDQATSIIESKIK